LIKTTRGNFECRNNGAMKKYYLLLTVYLFILGCKIKKENLCGGKKKI
jgi:hypothetical protein